MLTLRKEMVIVSVDAVAGESDGGISVSSSWVRWLQGEGAGVEEWREIFKLLREFKNPLTGMKNALAEKSAALWRITPALITVRYIFFLRAQIRLSSAVARFLFNLRPAKRVDLSPPTRCRVQFAVNQQQHSTAAATGEWCWGAREEHRHLLTASDGRELTGTEPYVHLDVAYAIVTLLWLQQSYCAAALCIFKDRHVLHCRLYGGGVLVRLCLDEGSNVD